MTAPIPAFIEWTEAGQPRRARWRSESQAAPRRVQLADDTLPADAAYRLVSEGTALLWRGDFQNARQLLQALGRRFDRRLERQRQRPDRPAPASLTEVFHKHRQAQAQRAQLLGMLLVELQPDYGVALRRAPDLRAACAQAWGAPAPGDEAGAVSLRELQGLVGAYEWRRNGVEVPALGARIHPHYGVFSPVRGEYVDLVAQAPLPAALGKDGTAFDIGTGTGVLAAMLARRGVARVLATELHPRALACARDNLERLGLASAVEVVEADLFPPGQAALVVCNPPWVPAKPSSALEHAVYDPDGRMLRGFLHGLPAHLAPGGEGWLILSDLAEHLGLRSREQLLAAFEAAGLAVAGRLDARPRHGRAADAGDPLHAARRREVTSLWRLVPR